MMLDDVREGRFQIARHADRRLQPPAHVPETFRLSSPQNPTGWSDEAFDKALEQAAGAVDPGESARLYLDAERIAVRGTARIPIFFPGGTTLVKPRVKGYHGSSQAIDLRWIWMDPAFREHPDNTPASEPLELPPAGPPHLALTAHRRRPLTRSERPKPPPDSAQRRLSPAQNAPTRRWARGRPRLKCQTFRAPRGTR
ncbi:MAG: hypothetical protein R3B70_36910 [Polyangiaceae bacterium]